ncbi:RodZ domain-containing protein [Halomonas sp. PR-M31]|uniref:RodZ domain-containing protein n=1 Tax=Halomonas sp. PR-M31 TaxID=1471202 RepID=UPI0006508193|nr:RodZ domain-containing protein [Halomonas sp. PR-M31]
MSDIQERQQTSFEPAHSGSAGKLLKSERERQGLSLEEVAIQLNLRPAVVAGLEADRYDEVPIAAYRRGYLRAYARLMGIDEREVVDIYNSQHGHSDHERKVTPVHNAKPASRVGPWVFKLVTVLVVLGLIALTLLWWQSRNGNDIFDGLGLGESAEMETLNENPASDVDGATPDNAAASASSENDTDLPPLPAEDEVLGLVDESATTDETVDTQEASNDDSVADADADADADASMIEPATAPDMSDDDNDVPNGQPEEQTTNDVTSTSEENTETPPATAPDSQRLVFVFNEESWTEVFDATEQRILVGLQSAGTEATAEGEPPFRLTIGNASGVELRYRGEEVDLGTRAAGTNVARFTLGE